MINASAYVHRGRLVILGVADLRIGAVPFSCSCAVEEVEDGPVDFGAEDLPEQLSEAIEKLQPAIRDEIKKGGLAVGAEHLVLRARQGDQNAMAILGGIRNRAKRGSKRAIRALREVKRYISENPPTQTTRFGLESTESEKIMAEHLTKHMGETQEYVSALTIMAPYIPPGVISFLLADGPDIDNDLVNTIASQLSDRAAREFKKGYNGKGDSLPAQFGQTVKEAHLIQRVRNGEPLSVMSVDIGWEMGD